MAKRQYRVGICTIEGCNGQHHASGYCNKHYLRYKNNGDPLKIKHEHSMGTLAERFWSRVDKSGDCWVWVGRIQRGGYGQFKFRGKSLLAHRISYELNIGAIPEGLEVDHQCHDRSCPGGMTCPHRRCVRPSHLMVKTHAQNVERGWAGHAVKGFVRPKKDYCVRGHLFDKENTKISSTTGERICKTCVRIRDRARRAKLKAERIAAGEIITKGPKPGTHCKKGHKFSPENTYIAPSGQRVCRICAAEKVARYRTRKKSQSA